MSFSDSARSSVNNNRTKLKSKKPKFRFTKMLPKSAQKSKSLKGFINSKLDYREKVKKDEMNHWARVVGLTLIVSGLIFVCYQFS